MILRWVRSAVWEAVTSLFGHWSSDYYFSNDRSGEAANGLLTCGRPLVHEQEDLKDPKIRSTKHAAPLRRSRWKKNSRWRHYCSMKTSSHLRMKACQRMKGLTRRMAIFVFLFLFLWEEAVARRSRRRYTFVWKRKIVGFRLARWLEWHDLSFVDPP